MVPWKVFYFKSAPGVPVCSPMLRCAPETRPCHLSSVCGACSIWSSKLPLHTGQSSGHAPCKNQIIMAQSRLKSWLSHSLFGGEESKSLGVCFQSDYLSKKTWLCSGDVLFWLLFLEGKGLYKGKMFASSLVLVSCWSCRISH